MRLLLLILVLTVSLFAVLGCSTSTPASTDAGASATVGANDATTPEEGIKSSSAQVVSDPATIQPGGSYRIEPKNPDDPKFKADPKLGGGG